MRSSFAGAPAAGFVQGLRLADSDRREQQKFEQDRAAQDKLNQVRDLQIAQAGMELDEFKAGSDLRAMERRAKEAQRLSVQALQVLDHVPDEQLGPMVADYMTRLPLHGEVKFQNGHLVEGDKQAVFTPNRAAIKKMMLNFADPEGALNAVRTAMAPRQYVVNGQVMTMTPEQAAQVPGARAYDDVNAGVTLGKGYADIATTEAQAVERMAQAGKHKAETQWIGPKAQADIAADKALAAERVAGARAKAAEIPGKQAEATDKQAKALRDETEFILKQLKISSGTSGDVTSILNGDDPATAANMLSLLDEMATNAPVAPVSPAPGGKPDPAAQPAPKYTGFEQQAATKALQNLQALGYFEPPAVTKERASVRLGDIDRMTTSGDMDPAQAARVVDSRSPEFLKSEQFRLMDLYGPVKGQQEFLRIYEAPKAPRH